MTREEFAERLSVVVAQSVALNRVASTYRIVDGMEEFQGKNPMQAPMVACMEQYVVQGRASCEQQLESLIDDVFGVDEQGNQLENLSEVIGKVVPCDAENIDRLIDHLREHGDLNMGSGHILLGSNDSGELAAFSPRMEINKENAKDVFEALAAAYYVMMEGVE